MRHADQLDAWLAAWRRDYRISVEVRHPDWYKPANEQRLMELLERYNAGHCMMDVRPSIWVIYRVPKPIWQKRLRPQTTRTAPPVCNGQVGVGALYQSPRYYTQPSVVG
jgi:uncharacterized protein YecE (DUF72 family)